MSMLPVIVIYLFIMLAGAGSIAAGHNVWSVPAWWSAHSAFIACSGTGMVGGVLYCLRAVYLNRSVHGRWNTDWNIWYFLRPVVSLLTGGFSYIFLQAGLLVLDASTKADAIPYGYLAVAFIAGYNVDNFLKKLEDIASTTWGIDKSRTATASDQASRSDTKS